MRIALKTDLAESPSRMDGRLLCFLLLPFFVVAEGLCRAIAGLKHDIARSTQLAWFAEAKSQASIATSYALLARSMLQGSERRRRAERQS
jgi:hypothetical protein